MNKEILIIVLPVFLVIGLGFGLKRIGLAQKGFILELNRLVYYLALPALLFYKIGSADFSTSFNGWLVFGLGLSIISVSVVSYCYGLIRNYSPEVLGTFCQGSFRSNLAYIGLAIVYNAYGESGFATAGIVVGFIVPLLNILSVVVLTLPHRNMRITGSFMLFRQIVGNPLILASFAGIVWSYLHLPFPLVIDRSLEIITGMSLPLALISIGATFSFTKLRGDVALAALASAIKVLLLPVVAGIILRLLGVEGQELAIGVILAGAPTATAAYIMAQQSGGDAELSAAIIMLSTLCSLLSYSVILTLLHTSLLLI